MLTGKYTLCINDDEDDRKIFNEIFDMVNRCPVCMLTVMRYYKVIINGWNFKDAMQEAFDSVNEESIW